MPLSEHEQKILAELEESLSKNDPHFARAVRGTNVYAHGLRRVRWAIAGFIFGLAILVGFLSLNLAVSLLGVIVMFLAVFVGERNLRIIGRAGWRDITRPMNDDAQSALGPRANALGKWLSRWRRPR